MAELKRETVTAFAAGMIGSGKSHTLRTLFTEKAPRKITIDPVGEALDVYPESVACYGLADVREWLHDCAEYDEWHLVASLDDDEIPGLFRLLAPKVTDDRTIGLARRFGGVAIECGECDIIAPNGRTHPDVKSAWKRARHHLLSLYMATQRPSECDRIVTSQSQYLIALTQTEPRDVDVWAKALSRSAGDIIAQLPLHHFVLYRRGDPFFKVCNPAHKVTAVVRLDGKPHDDAEE